MQAQEFIDRWRNTQASERANKDSYLKELCRVLAVPEPDGKTGDPEIDHYVFEADSYLFDENNRRHVGKMDLYRRDCFVLEAKQGSHRSGKGSAKWGTPGWNLAMTDAAGQAFGYARTLDAPPPFVIVADIGQCFDVYACFDGSGAYRAYPNAQKHRLWLKDLPAHIDTLRKIWLEPLSLDPRRYSEKVTQDVAEDLAALSSSLEAAGHDGEIVAKFLMRCVFTMFAEDLGLLRDNVFSQYLERQWLQEPDTFKDGIEELWAAMNAGKRFYVLGKLLRFNGGLFADPVAVPLSQPQLRVLHKAAKHDWSEVEPAIFGTLIERALNPKDRHKLGAHFTPPAYVRRLLVPTIEEVLRAEWELVRVQVREIVPPGEVSSAARAAKARAVVEAFHKRLCSVRILDPACGSGNFLYLAFHILKQLESEVLAMLDDLGSGQRELGEDLTVTPKQLLGFELRPGSKEIAELVLWVGYLQWHHKMYGGTKKPPEPILRDYKNIRCADAILAFERKEPVRDLRGKVVTRWDGETTKVSAVTGERIPDEDAQVPKEYYVDARMAEWPEVDFIVGNPPFIGTRRMRLTLGDGYVDALGKACPHVPDTADYVMFWWDKAAAQVAAGRAKRFGFITTNSVSQTFNRALLHKRMSSDCPISLVFAVPDHPWVDSKDGAAIRVAMTVGEAGEAMGSLLEIATEEPTESGESAVAFAPERRGRITEDLRIGASPSAAVPLRANDAIIYWGVKFYGDGFILDEADDAKLSAVDGTSLARPFISGRDLTKKPRHLRAIDCDGLDEETLRSEHPATYQWLLERVKPVRQHNPRAFKRERWWIFGENQPGMRKAVAGLSQYIVTTETAKHRVFQMVPKQTLSEGTVAVIALDDLFFLGVLSSRVHTVWALEAGGTLEDRPRYNSTVCFDPFPFPLVEGSPRKRIRALAEALDGHRKRQQAAHPNLTLTDMYNVLEKLRTGKPLSSKEQSTNEQGLISVLRQLHDDLDAAVLDAYGWNRDLSDEQILGGLIKLNAERAEDEQAGLIRWLRPDFQSTRVGGGATRKDSVDAVERSQLHLPWPKQLPHQVAAVRDLLATRDGSLTANEVAAAYDGVTPAAVLPALQTLEVLGLAVSYQNGAKHWKGLAKTTGERAISTEKLLSRHSSKPPPAAASG